MTGTVRIIGVGNPLMGDDGAGIAAVGRLAALPLPERVEVIDGGTGGLTLLYLMEGSKKAILIDAMEMGKAPGTVARFTLDHVLRASREESPLSLHDAGLLQTLVLGLELGLLPPEVVIFGVQPESVERRLGLSPAAAATMDGLLERVLTEAQQEI